MIGKWNKSVILSYIGLSLSVLGMFLVIRGNNIKYVQVCLMIAGICDLFDGTVARRCKRTKEEKLFGIELDSLVDVVNFLAFPVVILMALGLNKIYYLPIYILYVLFGVARLAYFNITVEDDNKPRKYYDGLPVTFSAMIFPLVYLLNYVLKQEIFNIVYPLTMLLVSILFVLKIKIPKPKLKASLVLLLTAIVVSIMYLFVL